MLVVAAIGAGAWIWQQGQLQLLRDRLGASRSAARRLAPLQTENAQSRVLGVTSTADPAALQQARAEVDEVRREWDKLSQKKATEAAQSRFAAGTTIPAVEWQRVGNATPRAAFETLLWAAAGGDLDAFAGSLAYLDGATRSQVQALFDGLPAETRDRYRTPERLLAALTIADVPTSSVEIREWGDPYSSGTITSVSVSAVLSLSDGKLKQTSLVFVQQPDGWKLAVPNGIVARYAARLKEPLAAAK